MTSHLVLQMLDVSVQDMTLHLLKSLQVFSGATRSLNDFWLNPLESKGGTIVAGIPTTRVFTVKGKTVNGTEYGYIELADLYPTCNSVIISLGENCNGVYLEPLQVPSVTPVDPNEFVAISNVRLRTLVQCMSIRNTSTVKYW